MTTSGAAAGRPAAKAGSRRGDSGAHQAAGSAAAGPAEPQMTDREPDDSMNVDAIKQILDLVREHELTEFELEQDGVKLRVRKQGAAPAAAAPMAPQMVPVAAPALPPAAAAVPTAVPGPAGRRRGRGSGRAVGGHVADRRHVLPRAGSVLAVVRGGGPARQEGPDALHHRSDEADERDRVRNTKARSSRSTSRTASPCNTASGSSRSRPPSRAHFRPDTTDVQENPDRQPRRDRAARHLRLPRARHPDRRRLFRARREQPARPLRRRRGLHRAGGQPRQLPERARDHQRRRDHRRRRHPSRLRVPLREPVHGRGLRGLPHQIHRPVGQRDPPARRQGPGPPGDEEGRRAGPARQRRPGRQRRARPEDRQGDGLSGDHQGGGRRRRARHAHRPRAGRARPGPQDRPARGPGGLRRRRRLHREVHRRAAPHRVPDPRRPPRQRGPPRRARVLDPAPPPEADRRGAVGGAVREGPAQAREHRRRCGPRGAVHQRRHLRVPDGPERQHLLHRGQHAPSGGARRHRAGHRPRHRQAADRDRGRPEAAVQAERHRHPRPRHGVPHQRRAPRDVHAEPGPDPRLLRRRRAGRPRRHVRPLRVRGVAVLRLARGQGDGARQGPHRGHRADAPDARDVGGRRHQDDHPAPPQGAGRPRLPGRQASTPPSWSGTCPRPRGSRATSWPRPSSLGVSFPLPPLYPIVDEGAANLAGHTVPALAQAFVDGGARLLQIRAKLAPSGRFVEQAQAVAALAHPAGALVVDQRSRRRRPGGRSARRPRRPGRRAGGCRPPFPRSGGDHRPVDPQPGADRRGALPADRLPGGRADLRHDVQGSGLRRRRASSWSPTRPRRPTCRSWRSAASRWSGRAACWTPARASVAVIGDLLRTGDPAARVGEFLQALRAR